MKFKQSDNQTNVETLLIYLYAQLFYRGHLKSVLK